MGDGFEGPASSRLRWVTGMGLVVGVDLLRGVVGVWSEGEDGPPLQALPLPPDLPSWVPAPGANEEPARDHGKEDGRHVLKDASTDAGNVPGGNSGPLLVTAPGRWLRRFAEAGGSIVVERGLVLDEAAILLLEWECPGSDTPGTRVALLKAEVDPTMARRLLADPPSRARIREARGTPYPDEAFVLRAAKAGTDAREREVLREALAVLDEASLGPVAEDVHPTLPQPQGDPGPSILRGAPGSPPPEILEGAGLAEYGLAALMAGRWDVTRKILAGSGSPQDVSASHGAQAPLPFLFLAARWCLWTGQALPGSGPGTTALDAWVERARAQARDEMDGGPAQAGAAFPPLARVLEELADGLEGLGDPSRPRQLRLWAEEIRNPPPSASSLHPGKGGPPRAPSGSPSRGLRLPVLGRPFPDPLPDPGPDPGPNPGANPSSAGSGGTAADRPDPRPPRSILPHPAAFGPLTTPAILPRQTLHAARLVRSWVEGILGVEPDAAAGRLTLSLDLRSLPGQGPILEMEDLRVGDARVALDCRGDGGVLTFRFFQKAGRVPLNLILQLHLPSPRVRRVWLGDEIVDVEEEETPEGMRLRCQFPLDPGRRMIVETGD
jgi:hypothetical protein